MKKIRAILTVVALSLFLSGMQSCYVDRDTGRHRWGFYHRDRDRDWHHDHDRDHRGGVILVNPERHDRDDHDDD